MEASTTNQVQKNMSSTKNHELPSHTEPEINGVKETRMVMDEEVDVVNGHDDVDYNLSHQRSTSDIALSDSDREASSTRVFTTPVSVSKRKSSVSHKHVNIMNNIV
jgi:hypothetical protein